MNKKIYISPVVYVSLTLQWWTWNITSERPSITFRAHLYN